MDESLSLAGIILAAGKGKRMRSTLPKVLHQIAGKPMLEHVLNALRATPLQNFCVVLGRDLEPFADFIAEQRDLNVCVQKVANGTGGAVAASAVSLLGVPTCSYAPSELKVGQAFASSHVLVCLGDCPALPAAILRGFIADSLSHRASLAVLGMEVEEPSGYGRLVLHDEQRLEKIVEERDATAAQRALRLCNSGVIFAETAYLFSLLQELKADNSQSEYYLTDCVALSFKRGLPARVYVTKDWQGFLGVNTPEQLQALEQHMQNRVVT